MYNGTFVTHVSRYMPGSLTSVFLWSRWQGKRSQNSRPCATRNCMYLVRGPCIWHVSFKCDVSVILLLSDMSFTLFYFLSHPVMGSCYGMRMFTWWFNCNWYSTSYHTHRWAAAMACVCLHGDSTDFKFNRYNSLSCRVIYVTCARQQSQKCLRHRSSVQNKRKGCWLVPGRNSALIISLRWVYAHIYVYSHSVTYAHLHINI